MNTIEENATEEPEALENEITEETPEVNNPETEQKSEEIQEIENPETREININDKNKQTHNVMKKHTLLQ